MHISKTLCVIVFLILSGCTSLNSKTNLDEFDAYVSSYIRNTFKNELKIVPSKRDIKTKLSFESNHFDAYSYRIHLPWNKKFDIYDTKFATIVGSVNCFVVSFDNPYEDLWSDMILNTLSEGRNEDEYDDSLMKYTKKMNNFELVTDILNSNGSMLLTNISIKQKASMMFLLQMKSAYLMESDGYNKNNSVIYHFETDKVKGYQIGNFDLNNRVTLLIFPNDKEELKVSIMKDEKFSINQDHIDFIISRIEKLNN